MGLLERRAILPPVSTRMTARERVLVARCVRLRDALERIAEGDRCPQCRELARRALLPPTRMDPWLSAALAMFALTGGLWVWAWLA